jgi:hypothetical protein
VAGVAALLGFVVTIDSSSSRSVSGIGNVVGPCNFSIDWNL